MNYLFSHGRTAFKYGLIYLGLKKNDKIMLPEYICDILIDPLKDLGITPIFYEINEDFTTNWKSLKKNYEQAVKALVVINYFGFEEDKKKFKIFCKKKKLFLIEDDCHSLKINKRNIKDHSDITFYSIHKLIKRTYSGGVLKINNLKKNKIPSYIKLKKYNVNFKTFLNNFLENNFLQFKRFLKKKLFKMPSYSKLNSIKNIKLEGDFLIDDFSKLIFTKKKFKKIKIGNLKTVIKNTKINQIVHGNTNSVYINPLNSLRFVLNKIKKDKINLKKDFYVFTGSTVGVVPIKGRGIYFGKIDKLGSVRTLIKR